MYDDVKKVVKIDKRFHKDFTEAEQMLNVIQRILHDFFTTHGPTKYTEKSVIEFLEEMWKRFSIDKYAKVFLDFARAEKALYGRSKRYRDHLIHVFNVYIMGLVVFSKILKKDSAKVFELLKIREEPGNIPFMRPYNEWRRLYYVWGLMSTFHDIAIPIQYRRDILEGLKLFLGHFKIETEKPLIEFPFMIHSDFGRYSEFMANLFADGIVINEDSTMPTYKLPKEPTGAFLYFRFVINNAMNRNDHGVFGAYLLFKSLEEMFLSGKNQNPDADLDLVAVVHNGNVIHLPEHRLQWSDFIKKLHLGREEFENLPRIYDLNKGETKRYNEYVLKQDVSRAALGIATHNLDPDSDEQPKIFPIKFSRLPLCFMLILLDELQEFCRPEGLELSEIVRFHKFPLIEANVVFSIEGKPHIQITLSFEFPRLDSATEEKIIDEYNAYARSKNKREVDNYENLIHDTWANIFDRIQKKLSFSDGEPLEICVNINFDYKGWKSLKFITPNWSKYKEEKQAVSW